VGPLITAFMMNRIADRQKDADDVHGVPIVAARNARRSCSGCRSNPVSSSPRRRAIPEQAVRDQTEHIVLVSGRLRRRLARRGRPASR
jgi:hypothetical protein